jgi:hypothetical protein
MTSASKSLFKKKGKTEKEVKEREENSNEREW